MLCTKGAKPALLSSVSEVLLLRISGIFFSWRCSYTCPVLFTGLVAVLEESYE